MELICSDVVIVLVVNLPIISMVLNSFRTTDDILAATTLIPTAPTLVNYRYVTERTAFWQYFVNSLTVAGGGMIVSILAATVAGYSLSRYRCRVCSQAIATACLWCKCFNFPGTTSCLFSLAALA